MRTIHVTNNVTSIYAKLHILTAAPVYLYYKAFLVVRYNLLMNAAGKDIEGTDFLYPVLF